MNTALLSLFLLTGTASAQTPDRLVAEIRTAAADACVTVSYSLDATVDEVRVADKGTVTAQDDLWCLKGKSVEIYTGPDCTWVLSKESKEAVVEPKWTYEDLEAFYKTLVKAGSGNNVSVKVLSKTMSEKKPASCFMPETGDDWVVTDLR